MKYICVKSFGNKIQFTKIILHNLSLVVEQDKIYMYILYLLQVLCTIMVI